MADPIPVATSHWRIPTLEEFKAANLHLKNHSSQLVLDPEEPVSQPVTNNSSD